VLREVIGFFERSQPQFGIEGERLEGVPAWDILVRTGLSAQELQAWMMRVGYADSYPAYLWDEEVPADLEEDDDPGWFRYQDPETYRMRRVRAEEVAVHEVRAERLVAALADLLDIPQALRPRSAGPLLAGNLWHLGRASIDGAPVEVWLVRRLYRCLAELLRYFDDPSQPEQGLILSAGVGLPEVVRPPRHYRVVPLGQLLIDGTGTAALDRQLLHRALAEPADAALRPSLPVVFDAVTNTLALRHRAERWVIRGKRQAAFVRYLFQQFVNNRHWVPAQEILVAVYGEQTGGRSHRVQELFRGSPHFADFIKTDGRGKYGFRLD
jgi:hypothetical protein